MWFNGKAEFYVSIAPVFSVSTVCEYERAL